MLCSILRRCRARPKSVGCKGVLWNPKFLILEKRTAEKQFCLKSLKIIFCLYVTQELLQEKQKKYFFCSGPSLTFLLIVKESLIDPDIHLKRIQGLNIDLIALIR